MHLLYSGASVNRCMNLMGRKIVVLHVRRGVGYHHGQTCATGHVGLVVLVATVCHQGLQGVIVLDLFLSVNV
ncbi:hypothetical protein R6Q59_007323 [Mikania micrantha]